jgi:hypothetical protein
LSLERRRTPRIPFVATAEIIDEAENTRTTSQLSDLSLHGCFVQLPNPFPEGTSVTIEIYKDEDFLETSATVAFLKADLQPEQYAYRADRSALDAVRHVHKLLNTGFKRLLR